MLPGIETGCEKKRAAVPRPDEEGAGGVNGGLELYPWLIDLYPGSAKARRSWLYACEYLILSYSYSLL